MKEQTVTELVVGPEISKSFPSDPLLALAEEIENRIACRAYELFQARGSAHGFDREDWLTAQSEIVVNIPVDVIETETEIIVRADVPELSENDLEVRVAPQSLCIAGKQQTAESKPEGEKTVYSEWHSRQIFRLLDLPSEINPDSATAALENGILEIKLLKVATGRKIPVRSRAASA